MVPLLRGPVQDQVYKPYTSASLPLYLPLLALFPLRTPESDGESVNPNFVWIALALRLFSGLHHHGFAPRLYDARLRRR